ncbi:hypothetical protein, partial [Corallococcus praedator]|uniref:hypothetical protein n=1 Tax=Corallococcus praedator TaxID=2316724 RepID=UPI001ABFFC8C
MAYQTYLGILDFFDPALAETTSRPYDTKVMPYTWQKPIDGKSDVVEDIFALQTALILDGVYPPEGKDM